MRKSINLVTAVLVAAGYSCVSFADLVAQDRGGYEYFSCAEIYFDKESAEGRLNELELSSIKQVRGEAEAAAIRLALFWPSMFIGEEVKGLDERTKLRRLLAMQENVLQERECDLSSVIAHSSVAGGADPTYHQKSAVGESDYAKALNEYERGELIKPIWAKAMATSNGSEFSAKANYIKLRAEQLAAQR